MSKASRIVLFTFDYELYLGARSGTVDSCLIAPTNRLLAILSKYSVKAIFFVDTTYLIRLIELKKQNSVAQADWLKIIDQIKDLFLKGHYVFPHLHPHWLDATYKPETNEWDLSNFSRYRFSSISTDDKVFIWERSIEVLKLILSPLDENYQVDSYRAGGWSIQPFTDFKPFFEKYGIRNDFSVRPGYSQFTMAHQYNFLGAPVKNIYLFDDDVVQEDPGGCHTEYTISSVEKLVGIYKIIDKIICRLLLVTGGRQYGDGVTIHLAEIKNEPKEEYLEKLEMASVESLTLTKLITYFRFLKKNTYMQFLSHPKMLNEHQLFCLNLFLKYATTFYDLNTDFREIDNTK